MNVAVAATNAVRPRQTTVRPVALPTSPDRAVRVRSVADEYAWLHRNLPGPWVVAQQAMLRSGGVLLDVLRVTHRNGIERDYYFDASAVPGRAIDERLQSAPVAPAGHLAETFELEEVDGEGAICDPASGACRNPGGQPCTLPSGDSACALMSGDIRALPRVAFHTVGRAALISIGICLAGERDWRKLVAYSLGAALTIEIFALGWTSTQQGK